MISLSKITAKFCPVFPAVAGAVREPRMQRGTSGMRGYREIYMERRQLRYMLLSQLPPLHIILLYTPHSARTSLHAGLPTYARFRGKNGTKTFWNFRERIRAFFANLLQPIPDLLIWPQAQCTSDPGCWFEPLFRKWFSCKFCPWKKHNALCIRARF